MKFIQSPYFSNRNGYKVQAIVVHTMVGFYDSTIRYFQKNDRQVSAHYCVSLTGDITQMVQLDKASHHAGRISNPTASIVQKHGTTNPNWYTIGIETADDTNPHNIDRSRQFEPLAQLIASLCTQFNLQANRDTIIGHKEVYSLKSCPGNINLDDLVKRVQEILGSTPKESKNMTHEQFYIKFLEAFRKHKNDIDWGDDKHKPESALLEDSALLGRMFDNIGLSNSNKDKKIYELEQTINDKNKLIDALKLAKTENGINNGELPKVYNGKKVTGYIIEP